MSLPKTTADQRSPLYGDVELLLSPGFLHHTVVIGGVRLGLRSLGPGDLFLLRARAEGADDREWQVWATASSIWMVNGYNLLGDSHATPRLAQMVRSLPRAIQDILFTAVLGLFARMNRASETIEAFMYEDRSRAKWKMLGHGTLNGHAGIPGAEKLGSNFVQRIWVAFNENEDRRHLDENAWEGFKLVAGTNAPKGIKKLDAKDSQTRRDELARRQAVMDRYYYYRLGLVDKDGFLKDANRDLVGARLVAPKTVEDLEDEMRRWVTGEQDEHDRVVAEYKARIMSRYEEQIRERENRIAALHAMEEQQQEAGFTPPALVAYTPEQLQDLLRQKQPGKPGARWIGEGGDKQAQLYEKYLSKEIRAGRLVRTPDGRIVDPNVPEDSSPKTLEELLAGRQVAFHGGGE